MIERPRRSSIGSPAYFGAGSAIFFYLLFKGRFIPRTISGLGLLTTAVVLASTLVRMAAPAFAGYLAFSDLLLLLAETVTGVWLVVVGATSQRPPASSNPRTALATLRGGGPL